MGARLSLAACDLAPLLRSHAGAVGAALGVTAENALSDCTPYVPVDSGALRRSGRAAASGGSASVEWGGSEPSARYARVQYYGVGLSHGTLPNALAGGMATHHWCDAAKAARGAQWARVFQQEYGRRVEG